MKKNTNKILYLSLVVVIVIAVTILVVGNGSKDKKLAESYQPIANAKASTYETKVNMSEIKDDDNFIGSEKADLKIFVYEDYSNLYSAELAATLDAIVSESDGKVVIVVRPYVASGSTISRQTALATMCAQDSGRWEEMRSLLFAAAKSGLLSEEAFSTYATELQMNEEEFIACLTNEEKSVKLDEAMLSLKEALVLGAPTMIVGDEMILGARPYADFVDSNGDAIEGLKTLVERKLGNLSAK